MRPLLNERPDEALGMLLLHRPGLADDAFDVDLAIIRASYQAGEAEPDPVRHTMGSPWNVTRFSETLRLAAPDRMLPSQLLAHKRTGFPPAESFYSPAIEAAVRARYARDYELAREKAVLY